MKKIFILFYTLLCVSLFSFSQTKNKLTTHAPIDLGLSVKWANMNIGASRPEDTGGLFAWGEIKSKKIYNLSTYKFFDNSKQKYTKYYYYYTNKDSCNTDYGEHTVLQGASTYGERKHNVDYGLIADVGDVLTVILDSCDDAATVIWGDKWRMPTSVELKELYLECEWEFTTQNGVKGYKVTGPNGNSIFMPGDDGGGGGIYSSASPQHSLNKAYKLFFNRHNPVYDAIDRHWEANIRPVEKHKLPNDTITTKRDR